MTGVTVAIVDDQHLTKDRRLLRAVERAGLWTMLDGFRDGITGDLRLVLKPDMSAFAFGSPAATDPELVETLVDAREEPRAPMTSVGRHGLMG